MSVNRAPCKHGSYRIQGEPQQCLRCHIEELEAALEDIANPVRAIQREADASGYKINGVMAESLSRDPQYLKDIARAALLPKDN